MLSVVCWKWRPKARYRSEFGPEQVNVLRRMVARCYARPHRFICVTDDPAGLDPGIEVLPLFGDFEDVPSPHGGVNPSCYRRLRLFHPDAARWFGERVVSLDLDMVLVGDVAPLWDRPEDVVLYGDTARGTPYNGSMLLLRTGSRPRVWTEFDPVRSPQLGRARGYIGSDQAWLGVALGPGEPTWSAADGVYSYRNEIKPRGGLVLPANARIVVFHGHVDPWQAATRRRYPWVREHYR
jgi:hypothetical protein